MLVPETRENVRAEDADRDGDSTLVPERPVSGCWRLANALLRFDVAGERTLDPGETLAESYLLLGNWDDERCLPRGAYRFDGENRDWSFDVRLRRAG